MSIKPTDDHRKLYRLLVYEAPGGLSREELSRRSGFSDRKMRKLLEELRTIAATTQHPKLGPLVIGYDPDLNLYCYGKTAEQCDRIWKYCYDRLWVMLTAAKAQAAAIEYHYKTSDPAAQDALFEAERTLNRGAWS